MQTSIDIAERHLAPPIDQAVLNEPYEFYRQLRHLPGIAWSGELGGWLVARHADVQASLSCASLSARRIRQLLLQRFPNEVELRQEIGAFHERSTFFNDSHEHMRSRQCIRSALAVYGVSSLSADMTVAADRIATTFVAEGGGDLLADFAVPVSISLMRKMIGCSEDILSSLRANIDAMSGIFAYGAPDPNLARASVAAIHAMNSIIAELVGHQSVMNERTIFGIARTIAGDAAIGDGSLIGIAVDLIAGGYVPLTNLIGNTLACLLRHPDQFEQVKRNPGLVTKAIAEAGRFESPNQLTSRLAMESFDWLGPRVEAGDLIFLLLGSGNRDSAVFKEPDVFDVHRSTKRVLTFGTGTHACLGGSIALTVAEIAIRSLLSRCNEIEMSDDLCWRAENLRIRNLAALHVHCH